MLLSNPRRRRRIINLTPLIDVVFLLLVFFMLASTFLKFGTVKLDTASAGGITSGDITKITLVHVGANASLRIAGALVPAAALSATLAAERASGKTDAVIVLRNDATTADLMSALTHVRRHGFASVRVVD